MTNKKQHSNDPASQTPDPAEVISTIRAILRYQCKMSFMPKEAVKFIMQNNLISCSPWPSWFCALTEAGADYICEHGEYAADAESSAAPAPKDGGR